MCLYPMGSSCPPTTIRSFLTLTLLTSGHSHMGALFPILHLTIRFLIPTYMGSLNSCQLTTLWIRIIPISGIAVLLVVSTQLSSSSDQKGWICLYSIPPTRCIWSIGKKYSSQAFQRRIFPSSNQIERTFERVFRIHRVGQRIVHEPVQSLFN